MNIGSMFEHGLCNRCGTCVGLCPKENIEALRLDTGDYKMVIKDPPRCNGCSGICYQICPGHEVSFDHLNARIFGKIPESYPVGNYLRAYFAYSCDKEIVSVASAGGMVTQMLIHALGTKMIDGVLAVAVGGPTDMVPQFYVATNREAVLRAAQSKYFPVPKNCTLGEILKGDKRFAVVGTPCQIHGLRKGQELFRKLREQVVVSIGLFCGRCPSFQAAKFIIRRAGYSPDEVNEIRHRVGEKFPDHYHLIFKNGKETRVDDQYKMLGFGGLLFMDSFRCVVCPDRLNELSDVSVGDAAFEGAEGPKRNIVITRTAMGQELMNQLIGGRKINATEVDIDTAIKPHIGGLINKKRGYAARRSILRLVPGLKVPNYFHGKPKEWDPIFCDYLGGILQIGILGLARREWVYRILHRVPYPLLQKLCVMVFTLSSLAHQHSFTK